MLRGGWSCLELEGGLVVDVIKIYDIHMHNFQRINKTIINVICIL